MARRYPPGFAGPVERPVRRPRPPKPDASLQQRRPWQAYLDYVDECEENDETAVSFDQFVATAFKVS